MGLFNGILRAQSQHARPEEEAIQTLGNRLQHATLSADRKSAVLGLKSFSRSYRESVIQHGLRGLLSTLDKDVENAQLVKAVLETLLILFLHVGNANEDQTLGWISTQSRIKNGKYHSPLLVEEIEIDEFSNWIADELISSDTHVQALMQILQQHEGFQVKIYALQLLEAVVATRPVRGKECMINIPLAVSTIVKQLDDINDPIRNESILLLMALSNDNFNIQKLVAFENTFGKIFEIIEEEGGIRGSILVQDCMTLLTNLLLYNASNQKFFLETDCVPKLAKLIAEPIGNMHDDTLNGQDLPAQPIVWTDQRLENMSIALEICRSFVNPDNQSLQQNQEKLQSSGIFLSILQLVFSPLMENPIRRTALLVTGDIIANNASLQLQFSQIDVPYIDPSFPSQIQNFQKPIPAPLALLNWALLTNSVHVFEVRLAAVHCLKCFFKNNADAKLAFLSDQIKASKNPLYYEQLETSGMNEVETNEPTTEPADSSLKSAPYANIFSTLVVFNFDNKLNPYSAWFAAVTLVYLMEDCSETRAMARELTVGDSSEGEEEMTSIQAISGMLVANLENSDPRIASGYLILLTLWLYEDFDAVNDFLKDPTIIKSVLGFLSKNSAESSELVHGMCTILVGICYEFCSSSSSLSRATTYELITKALGPDNYTLKVKQFKESNIFRKFDEFSDWQFEKDSTGLPMLFFIPEYVELVKDNFYRIRRALFRGPEFEPRSRITFEVFEELENKNVELKRALEELHVEVEAKEAKLNAEIEKEHSELQKTTEMLTKCNNELASAQEAEEELSAEVDKFVASLKNLQKEKEEFETSSKHYSNEYHKLLKKSESSDETLKQMKQKLTSTEAAKQKAEDGINKMSRELFQLSKQQEDSKNKIQSLEKDLAAQRTQYESRLREISQNFDMSRRSNEELKAKIKVIESQSHMNGHPQSNEPPSESLRQLQIKISEAEEENDNLMEKLRSAASVVQNFKLENTTLHQEKEALQLELATAYEDVESISKLLEEVNELKSANNSSVPEDNNLASLEQSLKTALKEKEIIEEKLIASTSQLEELRHSLEVEKASKSKEEGEHFAEQPTDRSEVEELNLRVQEKDAQLAVCAQRIENFEKNIELLSESANSSLNSFETNRAVLRARVDELEGIKKNLQDEIQSLSEKFEMDMSAQQDAYDELESTFVDLELQFANTEKNKEDLEIKLRKQERESEEIQNSLNAELAIANAELKQLKAERKSLEHNLLELEKSTNIIGSELQAKEALLQALNNKGGDLAVKDKIVIEMKERLAQVIAESGDSAQKIKLLSKELSDEQTAHSQLITELKVSTQKIRNLEQEVDRKTEELDVCVHEKRKLSSIQKDFMDLCDSNEENLAKISALDAEVASLKNELSEVSASHEAQQKSNLESSDVAVSDYAQMTSKLEKSILDNQQQHDAALQKMKDEYTEEKRILQQKIAELNSQVQNGKNEEEDNAEKLKQNQLVSDLRSQITMSESDLEERQTKINALEEELTELKAEQNSRLALAESKDRESLKRIEELKAATATLESKLAEQKKDADAHDQEKTVESGFLEAQGQDEKRLIDALKSELETLRAEAEETAKQKQFQEDELSALRQELQKASMEYEAKREEAAAGQESAGKSESTTQTETQDDAEQLRKEYESCRAELKLEQNTTKGLGQDLSDLLQLWEIQEKKLAKYKLRIRALDIEVSDSDDEA